MGARSAPRAACEHNARASGRMIREGRAKRWLFAQDHRRQRTLRVPAGARRAERRRGGASPQVRRGIPLGGARGRRTGSTARRAPQPHPRPAALVRPDARACLRCVRRGLARRARAAHGGGRRADGAAVARHGGAHAGGGALVHRLLAAPAAGVGLVICREFARHRIRRVPYIGVPRAVVERRMQRG